jgi:hypothetical protein
MIAEVYDALVAAGSPEDKARKAAEAIAGYEDRFAAIEQPVVQFQREVDQRFVEMDGKIRPLSWMVGFNLAGTVGIIFMLLHQ